MMRSADVWPAMAEAFEAARARSLDASSRRSMRPRPRRRLARQQAAGLLVVAPRKPWERVSDLRVDDHPEPLRELRRLLDLEEGYRELTQSDEPAAAARGGGLSELDVRWAEIVDAGHAGDLARARELLRRCSRGNRGGPTSSGRSQAGDWSATSMSFCGRKPIVLAGLLRVHAADPGALALSRARAARLRGRRREPSAAGTSRRRPRRGSTATSTGRGRPDRLNFTDSDEANELLALEPLALLIGFALDHRSASRGFSGPLKVRQRLGTLDAGAIASSIRRGWRSHSVKSRPSIASPARWRRGCRSSPPSSTRTYGGDAERLWTRPATARSSAAGSSPARLRPDEGQGAAAVLAKRFGVEAARISSRATDARGRRLARGARALPGREARAQGEDTSAVA